MSWEQVYHIERVIDFAYRLYIQHGFDMEKKNYDTFMQEIFEKIVGIKIAKIEDIVLVNNPWYGEGKGKKITFTDGTICIHKLVERYTSGGNYGCDTYKLVREGAKVKVAEINEN